MSIEGAVQFKHRPLNRATRNNQPFRLLEILPCNEPSSPIRCELRDANIFRKPSFKALSYVWGAANIKVPILLDSKRYDVTRNCYGALLRLRELGETRVWIDAICIDQTNYEEKAAQVPLMKDIYPAAKEVIVWLGHVEVERVPNAPEVESLAISLLEELSAEAIHTFDTFLEIAQHGEHPERRWKALRIIFEHPWLTRLWTHQELILATSANFVTDYHVLQFDQLLEATAIIHRSSYQIPFKQRPNYLDEVFSDLQGFMEGVEKARIRTVARINRHNPTHLPYERVSVLTQVAVGSRFNCYEPRDRVYAILGLLDPNLRHKIDVDYTKPIGQVYTDFSKVVIDTSHSLEALTGAGIGQRSPSCPSWVHDWSLDDRLSVDSVLDTIILENNEIFEDCQHHVAGAKALQIWKQNFEKYPTGCDPLHAWIKTITADMDGNEAMSDRQTPEMLEAFIIEHKLKDSSTEEKFLLVPVDEKERNEWIEWMLDIQSSRRYTSATMAASVNRTFFISKSGYMGIGPKCVEKEDIVCVILGCDVPLLLRNCGDHYVLVGECFVWSLMDGEAMRMRKKTDDWLDTFRLL